MTTAHQPSPRYRTLALIILAAGVLYSALSVARYTGYNTAMLDLGNMSQAIGSVLRGEPLVFTDQSGPRSRLSLHTELLYFLIVPLYALWSSPALLVILQAVLYALGALPVHNLALRRLQRPDLALLSALIYLLYPTAVFAVLFDMHGDTLAMPLLLFALDALDRRAWRSYALWIGLSLMSKFYIAAPVGLLALTLLDPRRAPFPATGGLTTWRIWRWNFTKVGVLTGLAATVYGLIIYLIVRPAFLPPVIESTDYVNFYFGELSSIGTLGVLQRLIALMVVLLPVLLLVLRAKLVLAPALGIILPVLVSTGPQVYDFRYHHYAAAMPFIIAAMIIGAQNRSSGRRRQRLTLDIRMSFALTLLFHIVLNDTPLGIPFWRAAAGDGLDPSGYGQQARDRIKDRWLDSNVPPGVPIMASNFLAGHLTNRSTLYPLRHPKETIEHLQRLPARLDAVDLVVADALSDFFISAEVEGREVIFGGIGGEVEWLKLVMLDQRFGLVEQEDGLLLFQRDPDQQRVLPQRIAPVAGAEGRAERAFGTYIELLSWSHQQLDDRRVQLTLRWRATQQLPESVPLIAVSFLEGPGDQRLRVPHLPSHVLLRPSEWTVGEVVEEQLTFSLPSDLPSGSYTWSVGWYEGSKPQAAQSGAEALIPESSVEQLGTLTIER